MPRHKSAPIRREPAADESLPRLPPAPVRRAVVPARQPSTTCILDVLGADELTKVVVKLTRLSDFEALIQTCSALWRTKLYREMFGAHMHRCVQAWLAEGWWPDPAGGRAGRDAECFREFGFGGWPSMFAHLEKVADSRAASICCGEGHSLLLQKWAPPLSAAADLPATPTPPATVGAEAPSALDGHAFCGEWRETFYDSILTLELADAPQGDGSAGASDGSVALVGTYRRGAGVLQGRVRNGRLEGAWSELEAPVEDSSRAGRMAALTAALVAPGSHAPAADAAELSSADAGRGAFWLELVAAADDGGGGGGDGALPPLALSGVATASHGWQGAWHARRTGAPMPPPQPAPLAFAPDERTRLFASGRDHSRQLGGLFSRSAVNPRDRAARARGGGGGGGVFLFAAPLLEAAALTPESPDPRPRPPWLGEVAEWDGAEPEGEGGWEGDGEAHECDPRAVCAVAAGSARSALLLRCGCAFVCGDVPPYAGRPLTRLRVGLGRPVRQLAFGDRFALILARDGSAHLSASDPRRRCLPLARVLRTGALAVPCSDSAQLWEHWLDETGPAPSLAPPSADARAIDVAAHGRHAFLVRSDGALIGVGFASDPQAWDGNQLDALHDGVDMGAIAVYPNEPDYAQEYFRDSARILGVPPVRAVSTGRNHCVLLTSEGRAHAWGGCGMVEPVELRGTQGGAAGSSSPGEGARRLVAAASGSEHAVLLDEGGDVWLLRGWDGARRHERLPDLPRGEAVEIAAGGLARWPCSEYDTLVRCRSGAVWSHRAGETNGSPNRCAPLPTFASHVRAASRYAWDAVHTPEPESAPGDGA